MIVIETTVDVSGVTAQQVFDFMIDCTDDKYQEWWPGTHFQFHTVKYLPGNIGNIVFFDESIGDRRIKTHAIIRDAKKYSRILWQLKKVISLPVWVELKMNEKGNCLAISHSLKLGFNGMGKVLDFVLRLILSKEFESDLNEHAKKEFSSLAKQLGAA